MKNRKTPASITAALSAGLLLSVLGGVAQAQALSSSVGGVARASASYNSSSNVLSVSDLVVDGYGANSHYFASTGSQGIFKNETGGGTTTTLSIAQGLGAGTFKFNVCSKDGITELGCSAYSTVAL